MDKKLICDKKIIDSENNSWQLQKITIIVIIKIVSVITVHYDSKNSNFFIILKLKIKNMLFHKSRYLMTLDWDCDFKKVTNLKFYTTQ